MPRTPRDEEARAAKAAETRVRHLESCYGLPHKWRFVRKGFDPLGKHTKSGYLVKHYAILRCTEHEDEGEIIAGLQEAKRYGAVSKPKRGPGRPRVYRRDSA